VAVVAADGPREHYGAAVGDGVRFEMFVYVADVDAGVDEVRRRQGTILREPAVRQDDLTSVQPDAMVGV
jgi:lactoylglutathione lyase